MSHESPSTTVSPRVTITDVEDANEARRDSQSGSSDVQQDAQERVVDAVHRSHHADSGLDVSGDVDEDDTEQLEDGLQSVSLNEKPAQSKPTLSSSTTPINIPLPRSPVSLRQEYIYADTPPARAESTSPRPYVKPKVISASVSLPIPNLTINTEIAAASVDPTSKPQIVTSDQPDSAPIRAPAVAEPVRTHRPAKSVGPSMLEQVISKTRPTHLPPKNKVEDVKHLKDWEVMMEQSRLAEQRKKHEIEERRLARERAVEDSIYIWRKEVVPNWREAVRKPHLRELWWRGIPTKLRGQMWIAAIGNGLAISKEAYKRCLARATRAIASGGFPTETMAIVEEDIRGTLPALHIFHPETGPLYQDLKDLLCAWVVSRSDEGLGYCSGDVPDQHVGRRRVRMFAESA
ncbi:hypothetical protein FRC07_001624 [Ceratobasidium sp. 392]|nr:hypothetical protein FRC07_001624 [Ceratobasidium sp. 392]